MKKSKEPLEPFREPKFPVLNEDDAMLYPQERGIETKVPGKRKHTYMDAGIFERILIRRWGSKNFRQEAAARFGKSEVTIWRYCTGHSAIPPEVATEAAGIMEENAEDKHAEAMLEVQTYIAQAMAAIFNFGNSRGLRRWEIKRIVNTNMGEATPKEDLQTDP